MVGPKGTAIELIRETRVQRVKPLRPLLAVSSISYVKIYSHHFKSTPPMRLLLSFALACTIGLMACESNTDPIIDPPITDGTTFGKSTSVGGGFNNATCWIRNTNATTRYALSTYSDPSTVTTTEFTLLADSISKGTVLVTLLKGAGVLAEYTVTTDTATWNRTATLASTVDSVRFVSTANTGVVYAKFKGQ